MTRRYVAIDSIKRSGLRAGAVVTVAVALACTPKSRSSRGGISAPAGEDAPAPTVAGSIVLATEFATDVEVALVDSGVPQTAASSIRSEAFNTGSLAIGAESVSLKLNEVSLPTLVLPAMAAAFVGAVDNAEAGLDPDARIAAIEVIVRSGFQFAGKKDFESEETLGEMSGRAVAALSKADLGDDQDIEAAGRIARSSFAGLAETPGAEPGSASGALATKIGRAIGAIGISETRSEEMAVMVSRRAGEGLKDVSAVTDRAVALGSMTRGFVSGLAADSRVGESARFGAAAAIPQGIAEVIPGWLPEDAQSAALSDITAAGAAAFSEGAGRTEEAIADILPRMAGRAVAGVSRAGVSAEAIASRGLAAAPFSGMVSKLTGTGAANIPNARRLEIMQNSLSRSMASLGAATDETMMTTAAPDLMDRAIGSASAKMADFSVSATNATQVSEFFGGLFNGGLGGLAQADSTSQGRKRALTSAAPEVVARAMSATATSLSSLGGSSALDTSLVVALPALASQSVGSRLGAVLSPDDLNVAFAAGNSRFIRDVQTVVASRAPGENMVDLAQRIVGGSLAGLAGAVNAPPTIVQGAADALTGKMGSAGSVFNAEVLAGVSTSMQQFVVSSAEQSAGGNLPLCSSLGGSLSDTAFEELLRSAPQNVVCRTLSSCPVSRETAARKYAWHADPTGERCFLRSEPKVSVTGLTATCPSGFESAYGIGCRPTVGATCAEGKREIPGAGCVDVNVFCPAGQTFTPGVGCRSNTFAFVCAAGQRWDPVAASCRAGASDICVQGFARDAQGVCVPSGSAATCPGGATFDQTNGCVLAAVAATGGQVCPAGFRPNAEGNGCVPQSVCGSGQLWDGSACRNAGTCASGFTWNNSAMMCQPAVAASNQCQVGFFRDFVAGVCRPDGQCPVGNTWDSAAKLCRATGVCAAGFVWVPDRNQCEQGVAIATCATCDGTVLAAPTPFSVTPSIRALGLSWSAVGAFQYLVVRSLDATFTAPSSPQGHPPGSMLGSDRVVYVGPALNFSDVGLDAGTTYHYQVFAVNLGANGRVYSPAAEGSGTPSAPPETVPPVAAFDGVGGPGAASLTWPQGSVSGYLIARWPGSAAPSNPAPGQSYWPGNSIGSGSNSGVVRFVGPASTTAFADVEIPMGQATSLEFQYRIWSVVFGDDGLPRYSEPVGVRVGVTAGSSSAPGSPSGLEVTPLPGVIRVSWNDSSAAGWLILRRVGDFVAADNVVNSVSYQRGNIVGSAQVIYRGPWLAEFMDVGARDAGETYNYRVVAFNFNNGKPVYSVGGAAKTATAIAPLSGGPVTPKSLQASAFGGSAIVAWTESRTGTLVLRRLGAKPTFVPEPGKVYAVGQTRGDSIVAFTGFGPSFIEPRSALTGNSTYQYVAFGVQFPASGPSPVYSAASTEVTYTHSAESSCVTTRKVYPTQFSALNGACTFSTQTRTCASSTDCSTCTPWSDGGRGFQVCVLTRQLYAVATVASPVTCESVRTGPVQSALCVSGQNCSIDGPFAPYFDDCSTEGVVGTPVWQGALSLNGEPTARVGYSAVQGAGGSLMIWGGQEATSRLQTGARLVADTGGNLSWTQFPTEPAPSARSGHTAVWTGTQMIVWGGETAPNTTTRDGGIWSSSSNQWSVMASPTGAGPVARRNHSAIWHAALGQMWVFGGETFNTTTNQWEANNLLDSWTPEGSTNAGWGIPAGYNPSFSPSVRKGHHAFILSNGSMVVWGGTDNSGNLHNGGVLRQVVVNATANQKQWRWSPIPPLPAEFGNREGVAVTSTGKDLVLWGGLRTDAGSPDLKNDGYIIDLTKANSTSAPWAWTRFTGPTSGEPTARRDATVVWAPSVNRLLVWGGRDNEGNALSSGAAFTPPIPPATAGVWTAMNVVHVSLAPTARHNATGIWTGTQFVVWGGFGSGANPAPLAGGDRLTFP